MDEQPPRGERVARAAVTPGEDVVAELPEPGGHPHRPHEIEDRAERHEQVLRGEVGPGDLEAGRPCLAQDHLQQAALADARLAGEQQQLAAAIGGLGEAAIREVEEVVAADEEGTEEGTDLAHRRGV